MVFGFFVEGIIIIYNVFRLCIKEFDRLNVMVINFKVFGVNIKEIGDIVEIKGVFKLKGGVLVLSYKDYRIVMLMVVVFIMCE